MDWLNLHRVLVAFLAVIAVLTGSVATGEWLGWPFVAAPLERLLSDTLQRQVRLSPGPADQQGHANAPRFHFLGSLQLETPQLEIAAPTWSKATHVLLARDVAIEVRYSDLWHAYRGEPWRIKRVRASMLDGQLERLADGRASWQFGPEQEPGRVPATPMPTPSLERLGVTAGTLRYRDSLLGIELDARLSLAADLQLNATGHHHQLPVTMALTSPNVMPLLADNSAPADVRVSLNANVGRASLTFHGRAADALHLNGMNGRFTLKGPSLAAVGDLLKVTLPTTAAFHAEGQLHRQGSTWHVVVDEAAVGASHLSGAFTYDAGRKVPMLSGRLGGRHLMLLDLGPALGTTPAVASPTPAAPAVVLTNTAKDHGKVLPDRPFDLAALRAMDADVQIDIGEVDLNTSFLLPLRPLHAHLQLAGGTLTLRDIQASLGQGHLHGDVRLDGRGATALWDTDLRVNGVRLEHWLRQKDTHEPPRFVSGQLSGHATLQGQGRSTAEILSTLKGQARLELNDAKVSHLDIEKAGLDLAEILGLLIKGDDMLPVQCAVADLVAHEGVLTPRVMVLDTSVSAVWVEGSLSLASEALALRALVMPKDFSLASLRMPLQVRGTFAHPDVSFEKRTLGLRLASAALLALVNPLGALIPLVDPGDANAARQGADGCRALMQHIGGKPARHTARQ